MHNELSRMHELEFVKHKGIRPSLIHQTDPLSFDLYPRMRAAKFVFFFFFISNYWQKRGGVHLPWTVIEIVAIRSWPILLTARHEYRPCRLLRVERIMSVPFSITLRKAGDVRLVSTWEAVVSWFEDELEPTLKIVFYFNNNFEISGNVDKLTYKTPC